MSSTVVDTERESPAPQVTEANGTGALGPDGWPAKEFHKGLGDHPLWQALLDEIEANRQADIAEANRLADLALEE